MIWLLLIPAIFCLHTALTLWAFIVIMKWKQNGITGSNATLSQKVFFSVGLILDASYNYSPLGGSLALWQFPRRGEPLFTHHLKRIIKANRHGYRLTVAKIYCAMLNLFDVEHCHA